MILIIPIFKDSQLKMVKQVHNAYCLKKLSKPAPLNHYKICRYDYPPSSWLRYSCGDIPVWCLK